MKILIVSQYFWPENFRINDLTQELVTRGHSVTVLTGIPSYPAGRVFEAYRQNPKAFGHYGGATVWRVPMLARGQGSVRLFLNYLSFVVGGCLCGPWRLRGKQADVVFVFGLSPVTLALPAILLGRIKRAPVVMLVLDLWPETLAAIGAVRSPRVIGWVGHMVKFIYERCKLVLGQSRGFLENIAKYCSDTQKIRYFPSWAEEIFSQADLVPAPEVPVREGVFNLMFAGNIGEAQDLPAVIAAAESLKHNASIRWVIVGDGRKSGWLQDEVERRGLQSSVLLLGRFPIERMPSFYVHADALLVSLKKDPVFSMTIPGKVQSYLMAGVPLVGMLDGEGAEVISEANAGLVCAAGDSGGLAAAVLEMAAMSADQRHQLGVNGRAFAQREFGRELLIDRLEVLLHEAIELYQESNKAAKRLTDFRLKRPFDLFLAVLATMVLAIPVLLVALAVRLTSTGPALYWSDRVGRHNKLFKMPKFRSMRVGTPAVATHLLGNPAAHLTPIGSFLRKSSLDELPQLWSILNGDMSFVGPRPALFNQHDLVTMRTAAGVHALVPGLTGWAQVNGRDELPLTAKVALDAAYLERKSLAFDVRILWLTLVKVILRDGVSH